MLIAILYIGDIYFVHSIHCTYISLYSLYQRTHVSFLAIYGPREDVLRLPHTVFLYSCVTSLYIYTPTV